MKTWHEDGESKQINGVRNFFLIKIHNVIATAHSCINNSTIHFLCIKYLTRESSDDECGGGGDDGGS